MALSPDPVPLREALRGLRHVLRSGGETLAQAVPLESLPQEAAALTRGAMKTADGIARRIDHTASQMAHRFLCPLAPDDATLQNLMKRGLSAADDFGVLSYEGLALILKEIGPRQAFISEAGARRAWLHVAGSDPQRDPATLAAALFVALREQKVLRDVEAEPAGALEPGEVVPVAIFALLLWLLTRPDGASTLEQSLTQSRALTRAQTIARDIARAASVGNTTRIAELFAQFLRGHRDRP